MKTHDFSNDIVVGFDQTVIDVTTYKIFGEEELEESLSKIFYFRNVKGDEKKFIQINIVEDIDLPIKKKVSTKCFLTTDDGEILTDAIELNIFSISEANKCAENSSKLIQMLKSMGDEKYDKYRYTDLRAWLDKYLNSGEFDKILNDDIDE